MPSCKLWIQKNTRYSRPLQFQEAKNQHHFTPQQLRIISYYLAYPPRLEMDDNVMLAFSDGGHKIRSTFVSVDTCFSCNRCVLRLHSSAC